MRNAGIDVLLIPLVTAMVVYLPFSAGINQAPPIATAQTGQPSTQPPVVSASGVSEPISFSKHRGTALVQAFLGASEADCRKGWSSNDPRQSYKLEFLIATVPDPRDSRLGYTFDRYLDAIQRAAEKADYLVDRFDLPWLDKEPAQSPPATNLYVMPPMVTLKEEAPRAQKGPCDRPFECEPGAILLRSGTRLLLVYLVGETPTAGVHKQALTNALEQMAELSGWRRASASNPSVTCIQQLTLRNPTEVRIMGPSFSGSAFSLGLGIQLWLNSLEQSQRPDFRIIIISGSATAVGDSLSFPGATFSATVLPDDISIEKFLNYVTKGQLCSHPHRVALLAEANTAHGQAALKGASPECVLRLPFPLHISQLRGAYQKARQPQSQELPELGIKPAPLASIPLEESGDRKDVIPPISPVEAASVELVLSNLLSTIAREEIRYVGLLATDVRDRIFLAGEIRRNCPDVVLFTFSADLLYLHPEANPDLQGMLIVSPYPLARINQLWTYPFDGPHSRLQFPNQAALGVYNATLALLGRDDRMLEYGEPFAFDLGERRKPAMWVTAVGRNALFPIKLIPYEDTKGYIYSPERTEKHGDEALEKIEKIDLTRGLNSDTSLILLIVFSLLCAVPPCLVICEKLLSLRSSRRLFLVRKLTLNGEEGIRWRGMAGLLLRLFGDSVFREHRLERGLYLFACSIDLLTMYLILACTAFLPMAAAGSLPANRVSWEQPPAVIVSVVIVLSLAVISAVFIARRLVSTSLWTMKDRALATNRRPSALFSLALVFLAPIVTLYFVFLFANSIRHFSPTEAVFFYLRATDLMSGVSPLLPLILVGMAGLLWGLSSLRRLRLLEALQCPGPRKKPLTQQFFSLNNGSLAGIGDLENRIRHLINCSSFALPAWYVVLFLVAYPCVHIFWMRFVPTIEGPYFDRFFGFAFFMVYLVLALAFLRFVCVWRALRRLLRRLSWHPMRTAFSAIHERFSIAPKLDLLGPAPAFSGLALTVEQAARLSWLMATTNHVPVTSEGIPLETTHLTAGDFDLNPGQNLSAVLEVKVRMAQRRLSMAISSEAKGDWRKALRLRCRTHSLLSEISRIVADALEPYWQLAKGSSAAVDPVVSGGKDWREMGEEFLALRVADFLDHIFSQLQNLVLFVTAGLLLMLLAATSYPFQPRSQLLLFNWSIILSVVAVTVLVFVQMDRDKTLSALAGTTAGQVTLNREFIMRVLVYAVVPILALLGAQFPELVRKIVSLLGLVQGGPS